MRIFLAFILYLVGCMLLSALLLPWLQPLFATWLDASPDRTLYRFGMLLTAMGLPVFLKILHLGDRSTMGWLTPAGGTRNTIVRGLLAGTLMLTLVIVGLGAFGVRQLQPDNLQASRILSAVLSGLVSGLVVGLIEEFFFRGPLQGGMRRSLPFLPTALLGGLFYALVHFIRPTPLNGQDLDIASSLGMLAGGLGKLADFAEYADSFVTLTVAGMFLSMTRERTGSIFLAIGLHAGWVMLIRLAKAVSGTDHASPWIWLVGDYDNVTGWLASLVIGISGIAYWVTGKPQRASQEGA